MKIAIACDHGAFDLKQKVSAHLSAKGYEVVDFGTHSRDSCDYPDFAG
ncbi:MAG: RpiB/LacA/LacB family sugar-phosphate isomerase, partial [Candidatus Faecousia sp.]|nr:RpiB/LacA/LacB family sugar-phosphate isomerase [Candidatus Faecousia sp.]